MGHANHIHFWENTVVGHANQIHFGENTVVGHVNQVQNLSIRISLLCTAMLELSTSEVQLSLEERIKHKICRKCRRSESLRDDMEFTGKILQIASILDKVKLIGST